MVQTLNYLKETPSQTAGPYVHIGLIPHQAGFEIFQKNFGNVLVGPTTRGERITVEGRIFDGSGTALRDVLVEIWQANSEGRYQHSADSQDKKLDEDFRGWGRTGADFSSGLYSFETIKPGPVAGRRGAKQMAPHINFWIVARGINVGLNTRMYFSDATADNAADPVLKLVEDEARRQTLIGQRSLRHGKVIYTFDIRIQGDKETVFFDI